MLRRIVGAFCLILPLMFMLAAPRAVVEARTQLVRVKVKAANVRKGPGTRFQKVWRAPRNYPYRVIQRKGRWLKVRSFDGHVEWIYEPLTDRSSAVIVNVRKANVRSGPGRKNPVIFTAEKGVPFLVLRKKGNWLKVRHEDGDEGWIFRKLVWGKLP